MQSYILIAMLLVAAASAATVVVPQATKVAGASAGTGTPPAIAKANAVIVTNCQWQFYQVTIAAQTNILTIEMQAWSGVANADAPSATTGVEVFANIGVNPQNTAPNGLTVFANAKICDTLNANLRCYQEFDCSYTSAASTIIYFGVRYSGPDASPKAIAYTFVATPWNVQATSLGNLPITLATGDLASAVNFNDATSLNADQFVHYYFDYVASTTSTQTPQSLGGDLVFNFSSIVMSNDYRTWLVVNRNALATNNLQTGNVVNGPPTPDAGCSVAKQQQIAGQAAGKKFVSLRIPYCSLVSARYYIAILLPATKNTQTVRGTLTVKLEPATAVTLTPGTPTLSPVDRFDIIDKGETPLARYYQFTGAANSQIQVTIHAVEGGKLNAVVTTGYLYNLNPCYADGYQTAGCHNSPCNVAPTYPPIEACPSNFEMACTVEVEPCQSRAVIYYVTVYTANANFDDGTKRGISYLINVLIKPIAATPVFAQTPTIAGLGEVTGKVMEDSFNHYIVSVTAAQVPAAGTGNNPSLLVEIYRDSTMGEINTYYNFGSFAGPTATGSTTQYCYPYTQTCTTTNVALAESAQNQNDDRCYYVFCNIAAAGDYYFSVSTVNARNVSTTNAQYYNIPIAYTVVAKLSYPQQAVLWRSYEGYTLTGQYQHYYVDIAATTPYDARIWDFAVYFTNIKGAVCNTGVTKTSSKAYVNFANTTFNQAGCTPCYENSWTMTCTNSGSTCNSLALNASYTEQCSWRFTQDAGSSASWPACSACKVRTIPNGRYYFSILGGKREIGTQISREIQFTFTASLQKIDNPLPTPMISEGVSTYTIRTAAKSALPLRNQTQYFQIDTSTAQEGENSIFVKLVFREWFNNGQPASYTKDMQMSMWLSSGLEAAAPTALTPAYPSCAQYFCQTRKYSDRAAVLSGAGDTGYSECKVYEHCKFDPKKKWFIVVQATSANTTIQTVPYTLDVEIFKEAVTPLTSGTPYPWQVASLAWDHYSIVVGAGARWTQKMLVELYMDADQRELASVTAHFGSLAAGTLGSQNTADGTYGNTGAPFVPSCGASDCGAVDFTCTQSNQNTADTEFGFRKCVIVIQTCQMKTGTWYFAVSKASNIYDLPVEYTLTVTISPEVIPLAISNTNGGNGVSGMPRDDALYVGDHQIYSYTWTGGAGQKLWFEIDNVKNGKVTLQVAKNRIWGQCACYSFIDVTSANKILYKDVPVDTFQPVDICTVQGPITYYLWVSVNSTTSTSSAIKTGYTIQVHTQANAFQTLKWDTPAKGWVVQYVDPYINPRAGAINYWQLPVDSTPFPSYVKLNITNGHNGQNTNNNANIAARLLYSGLLCGASETSIDAVNCDTIPADTLRPAPTNQKCQNSGFCPYTPTSQVPYIEIRGLSARGSNYFITASLVGPGTVTLGTQFQIIAGDNFKQDATKYLNAQYRYYQMQITSANMPAGASLIGKLDTLNAGSAGNINLFPPGGFTDCKATSNTNPACTLTNQGDTCLVRWCKITYGTWVIAVKTTNNANYVAAFTFSSSPAVTPACTDFTCSTNIKKDQIIAYTYTQAANTPLAKIVFTLSMTTGTALMFIKVGTPDWAAGGAGATQCGGVQCTDAGNTQCTFLPCCTTSGTVFNIIVQATADATGVKVTPTFENLIDASGTVAVSASFPSSAQTPMVIATNNHYAQAVSAAGAISTSQSYYWSYARTAAPGAFTVWQRDDAAQPAVQGTGLTNCIAASNAICTTGATTTSCTRAVNCPANNVATWGFLGTTAGSVTMQSIVSPPVMQHTCQSADSCVFTNNAIMTSNGLADSTIWYNQHQFDLTTLMNKWWANDITVTVTMNAGASTAVGSLKCYIGAGTARRGDPTVPAANKDTCLNAGTGVFQNAAGNLFATTKFNKCDANRVAGIYSMACTFGAAGTNLAYTISIVPTPNTPQPPTFTVLTAGGNAVNTTWTGGATSAQNRVDYYVWPYSALPASQGWGLLSVNLNVTGAANTDTIKLSSYLGTAGTHGGFYDTCVTYTPCANPKAQPNCNCQYFIYPCSYPTSNLLFKVDAGAANVAKNYVLSVVRTSPTFGTLAFPTPAPISMYYNQYLLYQVDVYALLKANFPTVGSALGQKVTITFLADTCGSINVMYKYGSPALPDALTPTTAGCCYDQKDNAVTGATKSTWSYTLCTDNLPTTKFLYITVQGAKANYVKYNTRINWWTTVAVTQTAAVITGIQLEQLYTHATTYAGAVYLDQDDALTEGSEMYLYSAVATATDSKLPTMYWEVWQPGCANKPYTALDVTALFVCIDSSSAAGGGLTACDTNDVWCLFAIDPANFRQGKFVWYETAAARVNANMVFWIENAVRQPVIGDCYSRYTSNIGTPYQYEFYDVLPTAATQAWAIITASSANTKPLYIGMQRSPHIQVTTGNLVNALPTLAGNIGTKYTLNGGDIARIMLGNCAFCNFNKWTFAAWAQDYVATAGIAYTVEVWFNTPMQVPSGSVVCDTCPSPDAKLLADPNNAGNYIAVNRTYQVTHSLNVKESYVQYYMTSQTTGNTLTFTHNLFGPSASITSDNTNCQIAAQTVADQKTAAVAWYCNWDQFFVSVMDVKVKTACAWQFYPLVSTYPLTAATYGVANTASNGVVNGLNYFKYPAIVGATVTTTLVYSSSTAAADDAYFQFDRVPNKGCSQQPRINGDQTKWTPTHVACYASTSTAPLYLSTTKVASTVSTQANSPTALADGVAVNNVISQGQYQWYSLFTDYTTTQTWSVTVTPQGTDATQAIDFWVFKCDGTPLVLNDKLKDKYTNTQWWQVKNAAVTASTLKACQVTAPDQYYVVVYGNTINCASKLAGYTIVASKTTDTNAVAPLPLTAGTPVTAITLTPGTATANAYYAITSLAPIAKPGFLQLSFAVTQNDLYWMQRCGNYPKVTVNYDSGEIQQTGCTTQACQFSLSSTVCTIDACLLNAGMQGFQLASTGGDAGESITFDMNVVYVTPTALVANTATTATIPLTNVHLYSFSQTQIEALQIKVVVSVGNVDFEVYTDACLPTGTAMCKGYYFKFPSCDWQDPNGCKLEFSERGAHPGAKTFYIRVTNNEPTSGSTYSITARTGIANCNSPTQATAPTCYAHMTYTYDQPKWSTATWTYKTWVFDNITVVDQEAASLGKRLWQRFGCPTAACRTAIQRVACFRMLPECALDTTGFVQRTCTEWCTAVCTACSGTTWTGAQVNSPTQYPSPNWALSEWRCDSILWWPTIGQCTGSDTYGCDNVVNSKLRYDVCGKCGGTATTLPQCFNNATNTSIRLNTTATLPPNTTLVRNTTLPANTTVRPTTAPTTRPIVPSPAAPRVAVASALSVVALVAAAALVL